MNRARWIAPSLMCCKIGELQKTLDTFTNEGIELLHIDVMDGLFVPNLQFGTDLIKQIRDMSKIPLDIHLMIEQPEQKISWFGIKPEEYVSIHYESTHHVQRCLAQIRSLGAKSMLALNPATPLCVIEDVLDDCDAILLMTVNPGYAGQKIIPSTIEKVRRLRTYLDERGYSDTMIEVDGNVSFETAVQLSKAGANIYVAGTSSVFANNIELADAVIKLRDAISKES